MKRKAKPFTWRGLKFEVTCECNSYTEWMCRSEPGWNWKVVRYKLGECTARLRIGVERYGCGIHWSRTTALSAALDKAKQALANLTDALVQVKP